ncbi:uncharacterized protein LACBIDRAFT_315576 [Laccaria bicolor S238N-H82]|uniref:Predicted protein n=1 Tax=Laccaria bicolor (strain S238N-H82 / ATCC MYA-4686) TaxID=486041 RepID=B0D2P1_LACBS|nr:uncharacterized protein LACBIDRAFT_315576 [Laccaria bicolor S238N-H82]EDR10785.1 predicted protein [Laccaria bicolor S238N-H82]|eukprot:XP_001878086.1 predicted protein [Laccaria bicolor S238N-H82]
MVRFAASILVAATLVAAACAQEQRHARRDRGDINLFEREIPFDLGDLSARNNADLYTREVELLERDLELLRRARTFGRTASRPPSRAVSPPPRPTTPLPPYPPPPLYPNPPPYSLRDFDEELFERDIEDELLERDFDKEYLVEREIDELD